MEARANVVLVSEIDDDRLLVVDLVDVDGDDVTKDAGPAIARVGERT